MDVFIKEAAKRHGISLTQLAEIMGVTRQTVYFYIDQGVKNPFNKLEEIAGAIGCDVWELFRDEGLTLAEDEPSYSTLRCPHCGKGIRLGVEPWE